VSEATIPDWINAVAAAIGAIAILIGLFGANRKFNESSRAAKALRRSEVAEELIALAYNADDALREIRNPLDRIPAEKAGDRVYGYQKRYERIVKHNELFKDLREAQIRYRAVIGDLDVDEAVEELFKARNSVAIAIETLADYARDGDTHSEDLDHVFNLKRMLFGSYSERDELGTSINNAVKKIEKRASPIARLERPK